MAAVYHLRTGYAYLCRSHTRRRIQRCLNHSRQRKRGLGGEVLPPAGCASARRLFFDVEFLMFDVEFLLTSAGDCVK